MPVLTIYLINKVRMGVVGADRVVVPEAVPDRVTTYPNLR